MTVDTLHTKAQTLAQRIMSVVEDQIITPPPGITPVSGLSARSCMGGGDLPGGGPRGGR